MLIRAEQVIGLLMTYRVAYIGGRYGSYKTALAFRLAHELLKSGFSDHLLSNCNSVWADDPKKLYIEDPKKTNSVIIMDEGGLFLKSGRDVEDLLAFMRKMNTVLIIPSVQEPTSRVQFITIQRVFTLQPLGLPLLIYEVRLRSRMYKVKYRFGWWQPSEIFGIYDTEGAPVDGDEITDWLIDLKNRLVRSTKSAPEPEEQTSETTQSRKKKYVSGRYASNQQQMRMPSFTDDVAQIIEAAELQVQAAEIIDGAMRRSGRRGRR